MDKRAKRRAPRAEERRLAEATERIQKEQRNSAPCCCGGGGGEGEGIRLVAWREPELHLVFLVVFRICLVCV